MNIFLLTESIINIRENGIKIKTEIDKSNQFLSSLKRLVKGNKTFLFIANNPDEYEENDFSAKLIYQALNDENIKFNEFIVLDNRNKIDGKDLVLNSDLIYLQGGTVIEQNKFLLNMDLRDSFLNTKALILGKSAGFMNLGNDIYNYPETKEDVNNPIWMKGLNLFNIIMIPHFNIKTGNDYCDPDLNVLENYYKKDSKNRIIYALPNSSYILIENDKINVYGKAYIIKDGIVKCINENEKVKSID